MYVKSKTKIKALPVSNFDIAGYNIPEDVIYYDKALDNYPELREMILDHELYHAIHKDKIWRHIYVDIRDIAIMFRYDFFRYNIVEEHVKIKDKQFILLYYYQIFGIIRIVFQFPISLMGFIYNTGRYVWIKVKEPRKTK